MNKIENYILPENTNRLYKEEASSSIALTRDVAKKLNELIDAYNELSKLDLQWKQTQEGTVRKAILYMKDNLVNTIHELWSILEKNGYIDSRIAEHTQLLKARVDNLFSSVTEGSTTLDVELIDGRVGEDGVTYSNLGTAIRTQIHNMNPLLWLHLGVNYNTETGEITLKTNSTGKLSYTDVKRKASSIKVATPSIASAYYDKTNSRPVAVVINITGDVASIKATTINTYVPDVNDTILFYIYLGTIIPVSLPTPCLYVDGHPYATNPSTYKKYNGNMVGLDTKLRIDEEKLTATLGAGYYVLPFFKTGVLYIAEDIKVSYTSTGALEFVVFDANTLTLSVKDRFHKFTLSEYCLGSLYRGNFIPVEMVSESVSYTNNDRDVITENRLLTINDMFKTLSDTSKTTKIVLAGDSITHGTGGTGFAQDGDLIISDGTKTYRRNPNGYCWGNLFKEYIESNFNAVVINNGCSGTHSNWWNSYKANLIPSDTDIVILSIGTNDRNNSSTSGTTKEAVMDNFYHNISDIVEWCHSRGIHVVLCSPIPATATSEADSLKLVSVFEMNEVLQRVASEHSMEYANIYNEVFYHVLDKDLSLDSLLPDGLHPNDAMYKIMFQKYLKCFNLAPSYELLY